MSNDGFLHQEKQKKESLMEELQNKFAKEMKLKNYMDYDPNLPTTTKEGEKLLGKLKGLTILKNRVKAQGAVVTAEMLTSEMKSNYQRNYGLSSKELERMLSDMQNGYVEDFKQDNGEYRKFETKIQSPYSKEQNAGQSKMYQQLGELLYQRRKEQNIPTFQLAVLEKDVAKEFQKKHHLSEKKLKKISFDIQTRAIQVPKYKEIGTLEEVTEKIVSQFEKRKTYEEQGLREDSEKRSARHEYVKNNFSAEYVDAAERYLSQYKKDPLDIKIIIPLVKEMKRNLEIHQEKVKALLTKNMEKYRKEGLPEFLVELEKEEMFAAFLKEKIPFFFQNETEFYTDINDLITGNETQMKRLIGRAKLIQKEVGKNRIPFASIENQSLKALYYLPSIEFDRQLKLLSERVEFNLKYVDRMMYEEVTLINRERFCKRLQEENAEILVFGTPAEIYDRLEHYMQNLPKEFQESEKDAQEAMERFMRKINGTLNQINQSFIEGEKIYKHSDLYMPSAKWKELIVKTVSSEDSLENMTQKLETLADHVVKNMVWFQKKYRKELLPIPVWLQLIEYRNTIVEKEGSEFSQSIKQKLTGELLKKYKLKNGKPAFDEEKDGTPVLLDDLFFLWCEPDTEEKEIDRKESFVNIERLKGSEFMKDWEFKLALRDEEEMFFDVLDKVLLSGSMKLKFLKNVKKHEDLNNLSYEEMNLFLSRLRNNMRGCIKKWSYIICPHRDEIKKTLLEEIIKGSLTTVEEFEERLEEEQKKYEMIPMLRRLRTRFYLSTKENLISTKADMDKIDEKSYYAKQMGVHGKFTDAHRAWELLKAAGKEEEAMRCCQTYVDAPQCKYFADHYDKDHLYANPAQDLKNLIEGLGTSEASKLGDKLSRGRKGNYINEFLMCGQEKIFLRKDINPKIYDLLTGRGPADGNEASWLHYPGRNVFTTLSLLRKTLKELGMSPEDPKSSEDYEKYTERLFPLMMMFYEQGNRKSMVMKLTGVEFAQELCGEIKNQVIRVRNHREGTVNVERGMHLEEEKTLEKYVDFYKIMKEYADGLLVPIIPRLLKDDKFWLSMGMLGEEKFKENLQKLTVGIRLPLEIMKKRFSSLGQDLYDEICDRFAGEILYGEEKNGVTWLKTFDDFFEEYSRSKLGDFSIPALIEQRKERDLSDPVIPYITEILVNHKEGLALAAKPKELHSYLDQFKNSIRINSDYMEHSLEKYFRNHEGLFTEGEEAEEIVKNRKEAFRIGLKMYLHRDIIYDNPKEFETKLEERLKEFEELHRQTKEDTKTADKNQKILAQIQAQRDLGMVMAEKDLMEMNEIHTGLKKGGSPIQIILGTTKRASKKQLVNIRKKVEKEYKNLPQEVRDCLYERQLSNEDMKIAEEEVNWLKLVYSLSTLEMKSFTKEVRESIPDLHRLTHEILTFGYIRYLKKEEKYLEPKAELIHEIIEELKSRHRSLSSLLDKNYTTEIQAQPLFWRNYEDPNETVYGQENPVLSPWRHYVLETMAAGLYTMDKGTFEGLVSRQNHFIKNAEVGDRVFEKKAKELVKENVIKEEQQVAARHAMLDYFRGAFIRLKEVKEEHIEKNLKALLEDEVKCKGLLKNLWNESEEANSVQPEEKDRYKIADRQTLEEFLAREENEVYRKKYNQLTRLQRQVFALSVLQEKEEIRLPSMQFVVSNELEESRQALINSQLKEYVHSGVFSPKISYERVMESLCDRNGKINKEVFEEALDITMEYTKIRQKLRPKEYHILNNGSYSLKEASRLLKREIPKEKPKVSDLEHFKSWILNQDNQEADGIVNLKTRLKNYNDYELRLLALALNDRTMLDYTTDPTVKDSKSRHLNEEKLKKFKEYDSKNPRVYSANLEKSAEVLLSYQLRDDRNITFGELTEKDFAKDALKRTTRLDWQLLERAMNLVKEILYFKDDGRLSHIFE